MLTFQIFVFGSDPDNSSFLCQRCASSWEMTEHEFARRMQFLIAGNGIVDTRGRLHANFLICLDIVDQRGQDVSVHRQNTFYGGAEAVCNLLQVVPGDHAIQLVGCGIPGVGSQPVAGALSVSHLTLPPPPPPPTSAVATNSLTPVAHSSEVQGHRISRIHYQFTILLRYPHTALTQCRILRANSCNTDIPPSLDTHTVSPTGVSTHRASTCSDIHSRAGCTKTEASSQEQQAKVTHSSSFKPRFSQTSTPFPRTKRPISVAVTPATPAPRFDGVRPSPGKLLGTNWGCGMPGLDRTSIGILTHHL